MPIVDGKKLILKAYNSGYAVGAFNISNLETLKGVIAAAQEMNAPVFVCVTPSAIKYSGLEEIAALVKAAAKKTKVPFALHLDHGRKLSDVSACLSQGFNSVMLDGSHLPFRKNISLTKAAVKIAHAKKIGVEAELGRLGGVEDKVSANPVFTDPEQAKKFMKATGADYLAVAIGTSHGAYKFKGKSKLDIHRLKEINSLVRKPLVLHGASSVPKAIVAQANKYGADIKGAKGVSEEQVRRAVRSGIAKVNEDTDLRLALAASVRKFLKENPKEYDSRKILASGIVAIKKVVMRRIKILGSEGKA